MTTPILITKLLLVLFRLGIFMDNLCSTVDLTNDVTPLSVEQSNLLLKVQKDILEIVIIGSDYQVALNSLCKAAEGLLPDSVASIMLYNDSKTHLNVRAAPSIHSAAIKQLEGLKPGKNAGSCGTAVFKEKPQYVYDTLSDERWNQLRPFAKEFGVHACWSVPVFDNLNKVIGSFALSSFEQRSPNHFQKNLLQTAASLVSLILLREKEEMRLQKAAYIDPLTELPNRTLFNLRLRQAISGAERNDRELAIFFIDLDKFKQVNDRFGHDEGDKVLAGAAQGMLQCVRREDTLARFGGDEFILLVESTADRRELQLIAFKLLCAFEEPFVTSKSNYSITASIGISRYPYDAKDFDQLLLCADQAMYSSKSSAQRRLAAERICFYEDYNR